MISYVAPIRDENARLLGLLVSQDGIHWFWRPEGSPRCDLLINDLATSVIEDLIRDTCTRMATSQWAREAYEKALVALTEIFDARVAKQ